MKRILSLIVVFAFSLSLCCVSYANSEWSEETEKKYEVLNALKIVNLREKGVYTGAQGEPDVFRNLSKTAFINYICNIYQDYGFTDEHNEDAIRIAEGAGIIHKNQTDLNKPLYYDEAVTMLVRLMGYGYHAEGAGGYPAGYIAIANRLGLTDGLSAKSGERLQEFDAITLLYNAINTAYVEIISYSDDGIIYGNASEDTLLYEFRKIYRVDGILEGTGTSSVTTAHTVSEGSVMINGYQYKTEKDFYDILGMNVEAYVHNDRNGEPVVLCAIPNRNEELVIPTKDISFFSADMTKMRYWDENEKERNISISPIVNVIYNGQPVDTYTGDDFLKADGNIRLINNDSDQEFEVAFISNYRTVVVDGVSALNETIKDFYTGETISFKQQIGEIVKIIGEDGEIAVTDLIPGDVLRVMSARAGGKKMVIAYLSRNKVTGTVTAQRQNEETIVTIDNAEYALSKIYEEELKKPISKVKQIQLGKLYELSLDSDGRIAYVKEVDGTMQYGIVLATRYDGIFSDNCSIKLFTTEGVWKEHPIAEKIQFDGQRGVEMNRTQLAMIPTAQNGAISVIGYMTDEKGNVISIDLPDAYTRENGKNGTFNTESWDNIPYRSGNSSFDSELFLSDNVKIWMVNGSALTEEDSYTITAKNVFNSDSPYNISAYNLDEFGLIDLLVVKSGADTEKETINLAELLVVEGIQEALDSEGNQAMILSGVMGGYDSISFYCKDDMTIVNNADESIVDRLNKGDVVSLNADSMGYVNGVRRYTSLGEINTPKDPGSMHGVAKIVQGTVDDISVSKNMITIDCGTGLRTIRTNASTNVIIYDLERNKIFRGTLSDIEEGNVVMTKVKWHKVTTFVVFQ